MFSQFMLWLRTFVVTDEDGQGIIEYALLAVFISIVAILILRGIGPQIQNIYQQILNAISPVAV